MEVSGAASCGATPGSISQDDVSLCLCRERKEQPDFLCPCHLPHPPYPSQPQVDGISRSLHGPLEHRDKVEGGTCKGAACQGGSSTHAAGKKNNLSSLT